jgi:hypothetical protein
MTRDSAAGFGLSENYGFGCAIEPLTDIFRGKRIRTTRTQPYTSDSKWQTLSSPANKMSILALVDLGLNPISTLRRSDMNNCPF